MRKNMRIAIAVIAMLALMVGIIAPFGTPTFAADWSTGSFATPLACSTASKSDVRNAAWGNEKLWNQENSAGIWVYTGKGDWLRAPDIGVGRLTVDGLLVKAGEKAMVTTRATLECSYSIVLLDAGGGPTATWTPTPPTQTSTPVKPSTTPTTGGPKTDADGLCIDDAWAADQWGLPHNALRGSSYGPGRDGWSEPCQWTLTGNITLPTNLPCPVADTQSWYATVTKTDDSVTSYICRNGFTIDKVKSATVKFVKKYPADHPFQNPCGFLSFEQRFGHTRVDSYDTSNGNINCAGPAKAVRGDPLSIVDPFYRSQVTCRTLQPGVFKCTAPTSVTITHPGGDAQIDLWPSYKAPDTCKGTLVENNITQRITCSLGTEQFFTNDWTYRENGGNFANPSSASPSPSSSPTSGSGSSSGQIDLMKLVDLLRQLGIQVNVPSASPNASPSSSPSASPNPSPASSPSPSPQASPASKNGNWFDPASIKGTADCTYDSQVDAWVCRASQDVQFSYPSAAAQMDVWSGFRDPSGCTGSAKNSSTRVVTCTAGTAISVDNFTLRHNPN